MDPVQFFLTEIERLSSDEWQKKTKALQDLLASIQHTHTSTPNSSDNCNNNPSSNNITTTTTTVLDDDDATTVCSNVSDAANPNSNPNADLDSVASAVSNGTADTFYNKTKAGHHHRTVNGKDTSAQLNHNNKRGSSANNNSTSMMIARTKSAVRKTRTAGLPPKQTQKQKRASGRTAQTIRSASVRSSTRSQNIYNSAPQKDNTNWYLSSQEVKRLAPAFRSLLGDLRSQLVKAACSGLEALARNVGNHMRLLMKPVAENLVALNGQTVKMMQVCATNTMLEIIRHVIFRPSLMFLMDSACKNRNKDVRLACVKYLAQIMECWPAKAIEPVLASMENCLIKTLTDPSQPVRSEAKGNFFSKFIGAFSTSKTSVLNRIQDRRLRKSLEQLQLQISSSKSSSADDASSISSSQASAPLSSITVKNRSAAAAQVEHHSRTERILLPTVKSDDSSSILGATKMQSIDVDNDASSSPVKKPQCAGQPSDSAAVLPANPFSFMSPEEWNKTKARTSRSHPNSTHTNDDGVSSMGSLTSTPGRQSKSVEMLMLHDIKRAIQLGRESEELPSPHKALGSDLSGARTPTAENTPEVTADLSTILSPIDAFSRPRPATRNMKGFRRSSSMALQSRLSTINSSRMHSAPVGENGLSPHRDSILDSLEEKSTSLDDIAGNILSAHKAHVNQLMTILQKETNMLRDFESAHSLPGGADEERLIQYFEGIQLCLEQREHISKTLDMSMQKISQGSD